MVNFSQSPDNSPTIRSWLYTYLSKCPDRQADTHKIRLAAQRMGYRWQSVKKMAQKNPAGLSRKSLNSNTWIWSLNESFVILEQAPTSTDHLSQLIECQEKCKKLQELCGLFVDQLTDSQLEDFFNVAPKDWDEMLKEEWLLN